jgi:hypothetical protein
LLKILDKLQYVRRILHTALFYGVFSSEHSIILLFDRGFPLNQRNILRFD